MMRQQSAGRIDSSVFSELKEMLLSRSSLPKAAHLPSTKMRRELFLFLKKYRSSLNWSAAPTASDIASFIKRHRLFEAMGSYLHKFGKRGTTLVVVEGGDATGKTSLTRHLGKDMDSAYIVNQSGFLFHGIFGLPKEYKAAIVDYSRNPNVAFLYYFVQNIYVLEKLLHLSAGGDFALLDSFVLRTLSSHRARPSFSRGGAAKIISTGKLKHLIDWQLNGEALSTIGKNRRSLFFVFLYNSESARAAQAMERSGIDAFDANRKYYSYITAYLKRDQLELRRRGVRAFSMLTVDAGSASTSAKWFDSVFIRSNSRSADLREKSAAIEKAIHNL
ncbi:MAG: hypothetical protein LVQ95_04010 [Candidatus Micrarchaeales archaeon]|nr:hypothetical protein [Candidatus Micrarchaeales archaeon]